MGMLLNSFRSTPGNKDDLREIEWATLEKGAQNCDANHFPIRPVKNGA